MVCNRAAVAGALNPQTTPAPSTPRWRNSNNNSNNNDNSNNSNSREEEEEEEEEGSIVPPQQQRSRTVTLLRVFASSKHPPLSPSPVCFGWHLDETRRRAPQVLTCLPTQLPSSTVTEKLIPSFGKPGIIRTLRRRRSLLRLLPSTGYPTTIFSRSRVEKSQLAVSSVYGAWFAEERN